MLYQLVSLFNDFPGARLMSYISFRAVVAGVLLEKEKIEGEEFDKIFSE